MIFTSLTFLTAIAVSAIAAYFSIVGLIAIFSAAVIPIAIMGTTLEVAKLVTASWVYRNWDQAPKTIKYYFTVAVVVLSLITSMGIFGYLSKAHIEQTTVAGTNTVQIQILEQQEAITKQRIEFLLSQNDKANFVSNRINRELQAAQAELKTIVEKKAPLLQEKNKLDAELGPLTYITEFIYGESNENLINKAVRWVIITLIFVFDPLAILLLIAANFSLKQIKKDDLPVTAPFSESPFEYPKEPKTTNITVNETINVAEETEVLQEKEGWSKEMFQRVRQNPSEINISRNRIHSIPKEILDKVFKK